MWIGEYKSFGILLHRQWWLRAAIVGRGNLLYVGAPWVSKECDSRTPQQIKVTGSRDTILSWVLVIANTSVDTLCTVCVIIHIILRTIFASQSN